MTDFENSEYKRALLEGINIMCRIFWGPDNEMCAQIIEGEFFTPFEIITAMMDGAPAPVVKHMKSFALQFDGPKSLHSCLDECYVRLFINDRAGIVPLYQSCYEYDNAPMMGACALKMANRLQSKGLSIGAHLNEPPDHLAIELEFLYSLLLEDVTLGGGQISADATAFARQTLLPWVREIGIRLGARSDRCSFFQDAVRLLIILLEDI